MNTKGLQLISLSIVALLAGCAVEQSKYRADSVSTREAIAKGEAREFLSAMEAQGLEAEKSKNWGQAATAYNEATWAAQASGELQKAISYAGKALDMAQKASDKELQVRAVFFLATVYRGLGQHAKAREWTEKGIDVTKQLYPGNLKLAYEGHFYRLLGQDFLRGGELQKAIEHLSYSLQVQEERLTFFRTRARSNRGAIETSLHLVILSLNNLASAYQRVGKVEEAIKTYERGLGLIKETGVKTSAESSLYQGLGQVYLRQKDYPRAMENLNQALELSERLHLGSNISSISNQLGSLFLQTKRPSEAIQYYKKAIASVESTRSLLESEELRTSFFEDKGQIYGGIISAYLEEKNLEEAFNYNERARSRAFLDILGSKVQLARSGALLDEERALQGKISALQARMAGQDPDASDRGQLRQELEEAQRAYNALLAKVRKENKEQASLMSVEPLTLKQIQELLETGVSLLEYFVMQGQVLLWVLEKDRVNFVRLSLDRSELISKVNALRDSIYQVGEKEKFKQASEELYRVLIEPAMPHIRGKELLIIPHDVLHYLPYQALVSPQAKYLIQDYPIYYLSSASLMQFTREKKKASGEKALVMGNPDLGDQAYNLRFAEREAKEVARVYPKSDVYVKADATKSRAVSLSPNYDILHFAVHGELRQDDPLNSGLLLAGDGKDDGRLRVGEIFSLNLKAGTVVLSACESGLGKISSGDEIIGLTRSFIYAGTPSIITTLWKVNDRTSYELVREFYSNLRSMKKSEALRQAQLATMKEFPHPFFWAAYGLTGEP
jgi:CHAT domain-containing protein